MDQFAREIAGALKATINAHGPITEAEIGSAAKRIAHALREGMKRERDRMMKTQPRDKIGPEARQQRFRELVEKHRLTLAEAEFTAALEEGEVDGDEVALIDGQIDRT